MLFSNATVVKLSSPLPEDLETKLLAHTFEGVSNYARSSIGWVSLLDVPEAPLTRAYGQRLLFCGRREEKVIPMSAVTEAVQARVSKQESLDGQKLTATAKRSIKDDVMAEMLPRALCKSKRILIYHDPALKALILNTGIENEVEDLLNLLRASIGSLNVYRWDGGASIGLFTQWLTHKTLPEALTLGAECSLFDPESTARITWRGQSLDASELLTHLDHGKRCERLQLIWSGAIKFTLDKHLTLRGLRTVAFEDDPEDAVDEDEDNLYSVLDREYALLSESLALLVPLIETTVVQH